MSLHNNNVAITFTGKKNYPNEIPFDPPEMYPEFKVSATDPDNEVYAAVRETFRLMGLDLKNYGKKEHIRGELWTIFSYITETHKHENIPMHLRIG